jgi:hypothetical protein
MNNKYLIIFSKYKNYFCTTSSSVFDASVCFPISLSTFGGNVADAASVSSSSALQISRFKCYGLNLKGKMF